MKNWNFQLTAHGVVAYLSLSNQNYTAGIRPREVFDYIVKIQHLSRSYIQPPNKIHSL